MLYLPHTENCFSFLVFLQTVLDTSNFFCNDVLNFKIFYGYLENTSKLRHMNILITVKIYELIIHTTVIPLSNENIRCM